METQVEDLTNVTIEIPSKTDVEIRIKALVMKLILCPDSFTLLELAELQTHMQNEGYM